MPQLPDRAIAPRYSAALGFRTQTSHTRRCCHTGYQILVRRCGSCRTGRVRGPMYLHLLLRRVRVCPCCAAEAKICGLEGEV